MISEKRSYEGSQPCMLYGLGLLIALGVALICSTSVAETANRAPLLWGDLQPGRYTIGFRVLYERDRSRKWLEPRNQPDSETTDKGRPIRISVWYPAVFAKRAEAMRYGDYFHYEGSNDFRELNGDLEKYDRGSWLEDLNEVSPSGTEIFARLCSTPAAAIRNARPASGRFPVVLYAGGLGSRSDANVELGEYLASHGYIVATVPQLGPSAEETSLETTAGEAGVHVGDLEFALKVLRDLPDVDVKHLAIAGHSAGGVAALQFAIRNPEVRVVVGLDGSYGMAPEPQRREEVMKVLNQLQPGHVNAFLLDMRRANGVQGAKLDPAVVDRMVRSDRYLVTFTKMFHGDFTEFGTIGLKLSIPLPPNNDERTRETGFVGNQHAYRAALDFLDANLKSQPEAMSLFLAEIAHTDGATIVHEPPLPSVSAH
jgi:pimeloyl-ACP methyl ester carboxylesterase